MKLTDLLNQCFSSITAHKLRSALAMLSILCGTLAVVLLLALGQGFYQANSGRLQQYLSDTITVYPGATSQAWQGLPSRRTIKLSPEIVHGLEQLHGVQEVAPIYSQSDVSASFSKLPPLEVSVKGVGNQYAAHNNLSLKQGSRFFEMTDQNQARRVLVLESNLAKLLPRTRPGDLLRLNGIPFRIIGIQQDSDSSGFSDEKELLIPRETFHAIWEQQPGSLQIQPDGTVPREQLVQNIRRLTGLKAQFDPTDENALFIPDPSNKAQLMLVILRAIQIFLVFCGGMTLSVGAIGVANIMFLAVAERTREIGLRMALGARGYQILWQFQFEALILILLGALPAFLLAWGVVITMAHAQVPDWLGHPQLNLTGSWITLAIITALGFIAGFYPARRAARLDPVIALTQ